jgi:hypothetical protein
MSCKYTVRLSKSLIPPFSGNTDVLGGIESGLGNHIGDRGASAHVSCQCGLTQEIQSVHILVVRDEPIERSVMVEKLPALRITSGAENNVFPRSRA